MRTITTIISTAPMAITTQTHSGIFGAGGGGTGAGVVIGGGDFSVRNENTGLQSLGNGAEARTLQK